MVKIDRLVSRWLFPSSPVTLSKKGAKRIDLKKKILDFPPFFSFVFFLAPYKMFRVGRNETGTLKKCFIFIPIVIFPMRFLSRGSRSTALSSASLLSPHIKISWQVIELRKSNGKGNSQISLPNESWRDDHFSFFLRFLLFFFLFFFCGEDFFFFLAELWLAPSKLRALNLWPPFQVLSFPK